MTDATQITIRLHEDDNVVVARADILSGTEIPGEGVSALAKVPPNELFKQGEYAGLYSKYDEDGLPTHDKDGEELAKAQRKKLAKTQAAQKKEHDKFLAKAAADQLGKATI